jgi:hypothetical protein
MSIQELLDLLAECQAERDALQLRQQEIINTILTPEIQAKVEAVTVEFAGKAAEVNGNIEDLTAEIKKFVIQHGTTVRGTHLMAVWNKGRVSWDSKKLDGMMALIPGLAAARSEGEPSVTIRKV